METLSAARKDELRNDARLVQDALRSSVSRCRHTSATTYWNLWLRVCQQYSLGPYLSQGSNTVAWLQIFAQRVCDGRLSASGNPVQAGTVAEAITFVAALHKMAGLPDPRLIVGSHTMDPRISRLVQSYKKADPSPDRVQPIPLNVLHQACSIASLAADSTSMAAADLMWMAFFFLLRDGEYTMNAKDAHPFTLADVRLWVGPLQIDPLTASMELLRSATFAALVFTDQKNAVQGEVVGHGCSGHPRACPVKAIVRRIEHLREHGAPPSTPLATIGQNLRPLPAKAITTLLRQGAVAYTAATNNPSPPIQLEALRATGATALLGHDVQSTEIKLIGRWRPPTHPNST
jgi:hypothetical protein